MIPYYQDEHVTIYQTLTRSQRYRLRKQGVNIPKGRCGPKKGYKQSTEHVEKKKRFGADHHAWLADNASTKTGRTRAIRKYKTKYPCVICGAKKAERHHVDGNTLNNEPDNIEFLCRKCHMSKDGRLERFKQLAIANQPKAVAARWR